MDMIYGVVKSIGYSDYLKNEKFDNIISETLRINSTTITGTNRVFVKNCKILGYKFRKGDILTIPYSIKHHNTFYFEEPSKFDENRFRRDRKHPRALKDKIDFSSFGLGRRNCIGQYFARFMMKSIINHLFTHFEIKEDEDLFRHWSISFVYGIKNVSVYLKPRDHRSKS